MRHLKNLNYTWREVKTERARRSLWQYCNATLPSFYKEDRNHTIELTNALQGLYEGTLLKDNGEPYTKLMINIPPRHGKSLSLIKFTEWCLGQNNENQIMTISYNEILSSRFSKGVRNDIETQNLTDDKIFFQDVFPGVRIKQGDASASLWSLENHYFNYLGGSPKGTITGLGCNIGIIDDLIKNKEEAYNERVLDQHYEFYNDTFLSRLEEGAIQIVNMTRWCDLDLCGRLLKDEPGEWYVLKMEAFDKETNKMLCPEIMSKETYDDKKKRISRPIFMANYHQKPLSEEGKLYKKFEIYEDAPGSEVKAYIDTADEGDDYLCSIVFLEHERKAYLLDVIYTQDGMEITEPMVAKQLNDYGVNLCRIESNNGGRGFARNVERILSEKYKTSRTVIDWFHQSKNKRARILSNSHWVMANVHYPIGWSQRWPDFFDAVTNYQKEGENKHDDAPDALTGVSETVDNPVEYSGGVY